MKKKKEISLLTPQPTWLLFLNRFGQWLAGPGRVVLIFTEFFVLLAFFSRFWLDTRNNDLNELIRQRQVILKTTLSLRHELDEESQRLEKAHQYLLADNDVAPALTLLAENLPPGMTAKTVLLQNGKQPTMLLTAQVTSAESLAIFLRRMIRNPKILAVRVGRTEKRSLETGTSVQLIFVLRSKSS